MRVTKHLPVLMRDDFHEVVTVGNAFYNSRGDITFQIVLRNNNGDHGMLSSAIELGLVEALKIEPVASDLRKQIEAYEQVALEAAVIDLDLSAAEVLEEGVPHE